MAVTVQIKSQYFPKGVLGGEKNGTFCVTFGTLRLSIWTVMT